GHVLVMSPALGVEVELCHHPLARRKNVPEQQLHRIFRGLAPNHGHDLLVVQNIHHIVLRDFEFPAVFQHLHAKLLCVHCFPPVFPRAACPCAYACRVGFAYQSTSGSTPCPWSGRPQLASSPAQACFVSPLSTVRLPVQMPTVSSSVS